MFSTILDTYIPKHLHLNCFYFHGALDTIGCSAQYTRWQVAILHISCSYLCVAKQHLIHVLTGVLHELIVGVVEYDQANVAVA